jgi:hypothetical protein
VDVFENSRAAAVAEPRQLAMYLLRDAGWTLKAIGKVLGKDHTTVWFGCQAVERRIQTESGYRALVAEMRVTASAAQRAIVDQEIEIMEGTLRRLRDLRASL